MWHISIILTIGTDSIMPNIALDITEDKHILAIALPDLTSNYLITYRQVHAS